MRLSSLFALPLLAICVAMPATTAAQTTSGAPVANAEAKKIDALFAASDADALKRNPMAALARGDASRGGEYTNSYTDAYTNAERVAAQKELDALNKIDRSKLDPTRQIAYEVFAYNKQQTLKSLTPEMLALTAVRPINHFFGIQTSYATFASGKGIAPFKTVTDYDNNLKRNKQFGPVIDTIIMRFRQGIASGVVDSKLTTPNMIAQLDTQLAQKVEESTLYGPAKQFPADFSDTEKVKQAAALRASIVQDIYPAFTRLRDFLRDEYLPKARAGAGLAYMKGGDTLYAALIERTTTLPLSAEYVHQLGLKEVARITSEMEAIRKEVGFKGTLAQFFTFVRDDPQFQPKSREWMTEQFYAIGKKVDGLAPSQFSTIPKAPLEIRPYEPFREKYEAGGSYSRGTPDGSRPGVFYFNAYDLPSRSAPGMTTLYLHEGAPGHHFQLSLAQENTDLPAFLRFGGFTAYSEGWALYAETLGYDFGLFKDPYQRLGHLDDEMLRAMRLVVDSGIHAKKWSREQAIQYMLDNSPMGKTDATSEIERYIAIPSQALAYKIGALTIQRLKKKAQAELGAKFDVKAFHAQILMTGALPMPILERKIDAWIAAT